MLRQGDLSPNRTAAISDCFLLAEEGHNPNSFPKVGSGVVVSDSNYFCGCVIASSLRRFGFESLFAAFFVNDFCESGIMWPF